MERFRKYIDRTVNIENVKNSNRLDAFEVTCRYLPDPPEDFDEFEFATDFKGSRDLGIMVTVELGKVKKILFGLIDPKNPDIIRPLSESQIAELLAQRGNQLVRFFDYITQ
ncbi:MAG TPA: hypothetical protein EYP21_05495 [Syntrophaceae bacterium]|nr:hypothetical protein [Syntrophaceae bacterium]